MKQRILSMNNEVSGPLIMKHMTQLFCMTHLNRLNEPLKRFYWMRKLQRICNVTPLCAILIFSSCYLSSLASSYSHLWEGGSGQQREQRRQRVPGPRAERRQTSEHTRRLCHLLAWARTLQEATEKDRRKNKHECNNIKFVAKKVCISFGLAASAYRSLSVRLSYHFLTQGNKNAPTHQV